MRFLLRVCLFAVGALFGALGWQPFIAGEGGSEGGGDGGGTGASGGTGGEGSGAQGGAQGQQGSQQQEARFTQADIDRAKEEERQAFKRQDDEKKKKQTQAQLAEQQQFKQLADERGTEIETLRPQAEAASRYAQRLNTWVDDETKDWPKEVKKLDPGKDKLDERLTWVENSRDLAAKLKALPNVPDTDAGKRNTGANAGNTGNDQQNKQQQSYRFTSPGDVAW